MTKQVLLVKWEDAGSLDDDITAKEIIEAKPFYMTTIGWITQDDNNYLTLSSTHGNDDEAEYRHSVRIPKRLVREIKILNEA